MKKLIGIALLVLSTLLLAVPVMAPTGEIAIDVKPLSCPNAINPNSMGNTPVAIKTTDSFDASTVDPVTVGFLGASPLRWAMEDYDSDGDLDMVLYFVTQECDWSAYATRGNHFMAGCLVGETWGGAIFWGSSSVKITKALNG